jgi:hypothetical protein
LINTLFLQYEVVTFYKILHSSLDEQQKRDAGTELVEVGPRFTLEPIKIFAGSFGGSIIYQNNSYVPPRVVSIVVFLVVLGLIAVITNNAMLHYESDDSNYLKDIFTELSTPCETLYLFSISNMNF